MNTDRQLKENSIHSFIPSSFGFLRLTSTTTQHNSGLTILRLPDYTFCFTDVPFVISASIVNISAELPIGRLPNVAKDTTL